MTTTVRRFERLILFGMLLLALTAWPVAAWSKDGDDDGRDDDEDVAVNVNAGGVNVNVGVTTGTAKGNPTGSTSGGATTQSSPTSQGGTNADAPGSGPPAFSRQVDAKPVSGTVRIKPPGAKDFVALAGTARLSSGSLVDTTRGAVRLTSPKAKNGGWQSAVFSAATFRVVQKRQAKPTTDVILAGGGFSVCRATGARSLRVASAARRKHSVRKVRGSGHGRFRTRGRYGSASVRGTIWVTEDRCDGTLVTVKRGRVAVRDFARHRTVLVRAGKSYFARARS